MYSQEVELAASLPSDLGAMLSHKPMGLTLQFRVDWVCALDGQIFFFVFFPVNPELGVPDKCCTDEL